MTADTFRKEDQGTPPVTDRGQPVAGHSPVDAGDTFRIDVEPGDTTDRVLIDLPAGKGVAFATRLHRQLTDTPTVRVERTLEDLAAEARS